MITTEFLRALEGVDVMITPTTSYPAHPIGGRSPQSETHSLTRPVSLTGLPALAMPCGFAQGGLPVSMQLIGRAWEEGTVLRLGHAYEQAAGWCQRRAPITAEGEPSVHPPHPAAAPAVDAKWVLDYARITGLSLVEEADAEPIAASIGPHKTQLAQARALIDAGIEPPVRPVRQ